MHNDDLLRDHQATRRDVLASWIAIALFLAALVACSTLTGLI